MYKVSLFMQDDKIWILHSIINLPFEYGEVNDASSAAHVQAVQGWHFFWTQLEVKNLCLGIVTYIKNSGVKHLTSYFCE